MKVEEFYFGKLGLIRQAIAAWVILFISVLLFATLSTLLFAWGSSRERSLWLSLVITSFLAVTAHMVTHKAKYSLSKIHRAIDTLTGDLVFALILCLSPILVSLAITIAYVQLVELLVVLAVVGGQRYFYMKKVSTFEKEIERLSDKNPGINRTN